MDVLVTPQPTIVFGLMGVQIVQDDMNLSAWVIDDDAVHEMQELDAPAPPVMARFDEAGDHIQSREQGRGAMTFGLVVEASERFAVGQLQPALGALQGLDVGLRPPTTPRRSPEAADRARQCRRPSVRTPDRG